MANPAEAGRQLQIQQAEEAVADAVGPVRKARKLKRVLFYSGLAATNASAFLGLPGALTYTAQSLYTATLGPKVLEGIRNNHVNTAAKELENINPGNKLSKYVRRARLFRTLSTAAGVGILAVGGAVVFGLTAPISIPVGIAALTAEAAYVGTKFVENHYNGIINDVVKDINTRRNARISQPAAA